jgi:ketosteroid isomerase-like protein
MIGAILAKWRIPAAFEAANRHDIEAVLKNYSNDIVFVYPGDVSASGTYRGKDEVRSFFERWFEQFPTVRFTVKNVAVSNMLDLIGNNVVATEWEVDIVNRDGLAFHNSGVNITTVRRGKAVYTQDYISDTGESFHSIWGEAKREE